MNIETVIYSYTTICCGMIVFNILCSVYHVFQERRILRYGYRLEVLMRDGVRRTILNETLEANDLNGLGKRLKNTDQLVAFDRVMQQLLEENESAARRYLLALEPMFEILCSHYRTGEGVETAYYCYLLGRYFKGIRKMPPKIGDFLRGRLYSASLYCRQNAIGAISAIGDQASLLEGLMILNRRPGSYHDKSISEALLPFGGDRAALLEGLWLHFEGYDQPMQLAILNYIRLSGGGCDPQMLGFLDDETADTELRLAAIRYFGRYPNAEAKSRLIKLLSDFRYERWEYAAVSATSLAAYSGHDVVEALKAALYSRDWYVRYNASASLERMGLDAEQLSDVLSGSDRYAREILQYRLDTRRARQSQMTEPEEVLVYD